LKEENIFEKMSEVPKITIVGSEGGEKDLQQKLLDEAEFSKIKNKIQNDSMFS